MSGARLFVLAYLVGTLGSACGFAPGGLADQQAIALARERILSLFLARLHSPIDS